MRLMRRLALWLPAGVYMLLIFHFSGQTDPFPSVTDAVWDKALHFSEYAGLALLLGRAFSGEGCSARTALVLGALTASLYGLTDETHQSLVEGRQADVRDWLGDTVGGTSGAALYAAVKRVRSSRGPSASRRDTSAR